MIEVLAGGVQTTVQDLGRTAYRASGVPVAGAMDPFALAAANLLAGNAEGDAALEALLGGLILRFAEAAAIGITGADLQAELDGELLPLWTTVTVPAGSTLGFIQRRGGARAYLAVAGGIIVRPALGSRSTYLAGGWGGYQGRPLRAGDALPVETTADRPERIDRWLPAEYRPAYSSFPTLRCVLGPHQRYLAPTARETFFGATYRLGAASDRMGYRLEGPLLGLVGGAALPSAGVLPGVIQTPPNGQPILLMADAQTTGGYPIIATVIGADLPLAAQLAPGDRLRFAEVGVEAAIAAARAQWNDLRTIEQEHAVVGAPI
jgi:biotin-dependent carboxylase-like uncharacterized protein